MMTVVNLGTLAATGTASAIFMPDRNRGYTQVNSGVVQVVGGSGTIQLEGSCDGTNFIALASSINNGTGKSVAMMPYMRANCTAYTSGNLVTYLTF